MKATVEFLSALPASHRLHVEQGNYHCGGHMVSAGELLRELSDDDGSLAEIGGFVIIDASPLDCPCTDCRRRQKAERRARQADCRYGR